MTILDAEAGGHLTINLGAIAANWKLLASHAPKAACAAVIKADAYGCGIEAVGPALAQAGCKTFFVAHLSEAKRLRAVVKDQIYVLNGFFHGTVNEYLKHNLFPVFGSLDEINDWVAQGGEDHGAAIHVDTGMNRLGMRVDEFTSWMDSCDDTPPLHVNLLMSHFACSDEPAHPLNAKQIEAFKALRPRLPGARASLANSSGVFLGPDAHHDILRPGVALYGANPTPGKKNPMQPVVTLQGRIVQVRDVKAGETVGYGATFAAKQNMRVATVSVGYADGLLRAAGGGKDRPPAEAIVHGTRCPFVGRVSMDLHALDVSGVDGVKRGDAAELLGDLIGVDDLAAHAGTIGYEILTSLGRRYCRTYV